MSPSCTLSVRKHFEQPPYPAGPSPFMYFLPFTVVYHCVSITAKRKVYYTAGTIAHNGPLFWLSVVERSLVKHISPTIMSHPVSSLPFYLLFLPLFPAVYFFLSNLWLFSYHSLFFIIRPSCCEHFHCSLRLAIRNKTEFSFCKYFVTKRVTTGPSVVFLPVPFQST